MSTNRQFNVEVYSVETNEVFPIKNVCNSTNIKKLKIKLELLAGIPTHLQRIMYLDEGDMEDGSTLRHHDVVSGARLTLRIWASWSALIRASANGHVNNVLKLGVTADSDFKNPNTEQMSTEAKKEWFLGRAAIALYIAAHRGNVELMKALIQAGVDIAAVTKHGRNALHVAAAGGQDKCVDLLLAHGAGSLINTEDALGETPLQSAANSGHKSCERRLFLFQWRKRAAKMQKIELLSRNDLMAHQLYDSSSKTWLDGSHSQHYQSHILPQQEFQGTGLDSKRSEVSIKSTSGSLVASNQRKRNYPDLTKPTSVSESAVIRPPNRKAKSYTTSIRSPLKIKFSELESFDHTSKRK